MSKRRKAREIVLQALYEAEFSELPMEEVLKRQIERRGSTPGTIEHASMLFLKTVEVKSELDTIIESSLENWDIERIALIDKNILRFALAELMYFPDVPSRVVINEAIEIAHRFSTSDAGRFINGLLDRYSREYRKDAV